MTDDSNNNVFTYTQTTTAVCPVCDRTEAIENTAMAQAWLTGHILEKHDDELPDRVLEE